ncbi:cyclase family protein [Actinomadura welshii]|uniref:cyclase family protein n=1 Tax=Actinomadura welshii TaxID=3103817 RepID=UPI0003AD2BC6|nr:cyclase family protein [Actinomadura madurae]
MVDFAGKAPAPAEDLALLQRYIKQCTNWGRWGEDDQVGAVNFIDAAAVRRGAGAVRAGRTISLTLPYDGSGPQDGVLRANPRLVATATGLDYLAGTQDFLPGGGTPKGFGYSDDILVMDNQAGTQWDSLSHIFWDGRMWNGRSAAESTSSGAAANGVQNYTGRIVTRGLLVDVPVMLGVESLEPGHAVTTEDIESFLAEHGLTVEPGDALLVRTGFLAARREKWGDYAGGPAPGLSLHTAPWLHAREIAAVATDTWGVEVRPNEIGVFQPLHVVCLVHAGIAFGEMFDLDTLARDCAEDGAYEFMLSASPLPLTGAAGSPVSAVAIK